MKNRFLSIVLSLVLVSALALVACENADKKKDESKAASDTLVTESEWNAVSDITNYFKNVTTDDKVISNGFYLHVVSRYDLDGGLWSSSADISVGRPTDSYYTAVKEDKVYRRYGGRYEFYSRTDGSAWSRTDSSESEFSGFASVRELVEPLTGKYSYYNYDESKKAYVADAVPVVLDNKAEEAKNVKIEFVGGKLARVFFTVYDEENQGNTDYETKFYDYGSTRISVPAVASSAGYQSTVQSGNNSGGQSGQSETAEKVAALICLHADESTYDKNFIDAFKAACEAKGLTDKNYTIVTYVGENYRCYEVATRLADEGYKAIFADSYGHGDYMKQAAKQFPDVQFYHASGTGTSVDHPSNFHNAYAATYEGRYLTGYAAGLKLNTMKDKAVEKNFKIGYVGAYTYAEVISEYTAFYLGVNAALDAGYTATMEVQFAGAWYDEIGEKTAAQTLISRGAVLVSQHNDSLGAPVACETSGVANVAYNVFTGMDTLVAYCGIDWQPYFEMIIAAAQGGASVPTDYTGTLETGSVRYALGAAATLGAAAKLATVEAELKAGTRKVFDCSKFTVTFSGDEFDYYKNNTTLDKDGHVVAYLADVIDDGSYTADTNVIRTDNGITYFAESYYRSAPYFDIEIDGITLLNRYY